MLTKKLVMAAVVALGFAAVPAMSAVIEYVEVRTPPPVPISESSAAPTEGQVWIPGYYDYRNETYVWVPGHLEAARRGYVYVAPTYEEREGRWRMYAGRWESEEEHGGLRNKIREKK